MPFPRQTCFLLTCLFLASCTSPWEEKGLVDIRRAAPGIQVDLRYQTADNITGRPLYPDSMPCLLRKSTALKLRQAQNRLAGQGYGLKIWDAWRPPEVHQVLYGRGAHTGMYLAPRRGWSRHCGGIAVDATLVDRDGRELPMPTRFDEGLAEASSSRLPDDPAIRRHLQILHTAMRDAGFEALPGEWWHFDDLEFLHHPVPVISARDLGLRLPDALPTTSPPPRPH